MRLFLLAFTFLLSLSSCANTAGENVNPYSRGSAYRSPKASVELSPLFDATVNQQLFPWSVAQELSDSIKAELEVKDNLRLKSIERSLLPDQGKKAYDLFRVEVSELKEFSEADFLVLMELVEHRLGGLSKRHKKAAKDAEGVISTALRLKVLDMRADEAKTVLSEIIEQDFFLTKADRQVDYMLTSYGDLNYKHTALAKAHSKLVSKVVEHISEYVRYSQKLY